MSYWQNWDNVVGIYELSITVIKTYEINICIFLSVYVLNECMYFSVGICMG